MLHSVARFDEWMKMRLTALVGPLVRSRLRAAVLASVLVAVSVVVWSGVDDRPAGTLELTAGGQITVGSAHPAHTPVTFGGSRLCVTGGPVTLTRVTFDTPIKPEKLTTAAWIVNEGDEGPFFGLTSYDGTPEQFLAEGNAGTVRPVKGLEIGNACPEKEGSFVDILVTAQASERGAKFSRMTIHYTSGGNDYSVTSDWPNGFCGTATTAETDCD